MFFLIAMWVICSGNGLLLRETVAGEKRDVCLIRLKGMINEANATTVRRKIGQAVSEGADLIILELDTPGGLVTAAKDLGNYIHKDVDVRVVAFINEEAISGGTMVALACDEIYIVEGVGMMGDVAPVLPSGEELGEKQQTYVRESLTQYAEAHGYPRPLVEAMVSKQLVVYKVHFTDEPEDYYRYLTEDKLEGMPEQQRRKIDQKEVVVRGGELLTMSAKRAVEFGFARKTVSSRLALYDELDVKPNQVRRLYISSSERLLIMLDSFGPLLMMAGLVLLFIEMKNPGFGLPGIAGLVCISVFFLVKYSLNYAAPFEIVLFFVGFLLIALEIFVIPGFGAAGILGILCIFVSLVLMLQQFDLPDTISEFHAFEFNILEVIGTFVGTGLIMMLLIRYMGSLPFLNRLIRTETMASASITGSPTLAEQQAEQSEMIGREGVAITPLRPAGKAEIGAEQLDVVAQGEMIEKGTPVKVIAVRGRRIVVTTTRTGEK